MMGARGWRDARLGSQAKQWGWPLEARQVEDKDPPLKSPEGVRLGHRLPASGAGKE